MGIFGAFVRLFRIEHALMLCFAVLLAIGISAGAASVAMPAFSVILAALSVPLFIEMGSFALNDYFDVKTDKANKRRDRPVASGEISPETALLAAVLCYAAGVVFALPLPAAAFEVAVVFAAASLLYNWKMKDMPFIGNAYIAASMAVPFVFGNLVVGVVMQPALLAIAGVAFVAGLGREIIKSAEDMEGDVKHRKSKTLPAVIGKKNAALLASSLYFTVVPLAFCPFFYGLPMSTLSLGLVAITALAFAFLGYSVARDQGKPSLASARKASLLALGVGLLGYAASLI